jgi:hypothetical protein
VIRFFEVEHVSITSRVNRISDLMNRRLGLAMNPTASRCLIGVIAIAWLIATVTVTSAEFASIGCDAQMGESDDESAFDSAASLVKKNCKSKSLAEQFEKLGLVYENDDNPIMQELWFLGRYHGQYYSAEGNTGESEAWEDRRFRIGSQARFFEKLTLHSQMVSGSDFEPFYNGFTELWAQWAFEDYLMLTVGQQKHRFTHDRNVSSRYLNTLERSMLVNMFAMDYTPAVTLSGTVEKTRYYTGVFSNATGTDMWEAFTDLDSGYSLMACVSYDLEKSLGTDTAEVYASFLHSDAKANATNLNRFGEGVSTALLLTQGTGSLVSEAVAGLGSDNGDAYGINIQPGYFFTDKLQLATRYQLAISGESDGLVPQRRYERPAGFMPGDLYQAGYAGFNYYIAGHRLKLMNGIEYAEMNGQCLWTASLAVRVFWGPHASGAFPTNQLLSSD